MAKDINLLPEKEVKTKREEAAIGGFYKLSLVFIALVAIVAGGVFGVGQFFSLQVKAVERANDNLTSIINNLRSREILLQSTKSKAKGISEIVSKRPDFASVLDDISGLLPDGVQLSELQVDRKGMVKLTAKADNSSSLNTFLTALNDPEKGGKMFNKLTVTSIKNDKSGGYLVVLTMNLIGGKWKTG